MHKKKASGPEDVWWLSKSWVTKIEVHCLRAREEQAIQETVCPVRQGLQTAFRHRRASTSDPFHQESVNFAFITQEDGKWEGEGSGFRYG
jgi:hypothetical protein